MTARTAIIVGAGPNGLSAAITLARAGYAVEVREGTTTIGGGARSAQLTLPGFVHDVCSAVHPLAVASPFFRTLPLAEHGLEWIEPATPLAHPLDDGPPVMLERSIASTAEGLDRDARSYRGLIEPFVARWGDLFSDVLAPLGIPHHPVLLTRFGLPAIRSAAALARSTFAGSRARALFAGLAAHSMMPLTAPGTAAFGLVLAIAGHAVGWPIPRGGSQRIADALAATLRSLGGMIVTDAPVRSLTELHTADATLLDVTPRQLRRIAGDRLPNAYRRALERFRYGPGVFKVDWALSQPVPWRNPECARAGTVHLGGTLDDVMAAEDAAWTGAIPERPFVLVAQPSLFDATRAPAGRHTLWGYCHVPNGATVDMTSRIEAQIERFAPGFRDVILERHVMAPADMQARNRNLVGGDIGGGANTLGQIFFGPSVRRVPYATPIDGLYLCSSSTPPRGGVHGMCGYHAARAVLHER
ncbi:MAG TPA: NAD(P)/FAD-dependent oxidoreductase [Gemmatimonadaceae bacterium]|nr:NAD(P)/FAD-dependent oxidoreductase [Gemmatimonadaceae bacterium]